MLLHKLLYTILLTLLPTILSAQIFEPVKYSARLIDHDNGTADIEFSASIEKGWHIYAPDIDSDAGPIVATITFDKDNGITPKGPLKAKGNAIEKYDEMFGTNLKYYEDNVTFSQTISFTNSTYEIDCYVEYGACSQTACLPPQRMHFSNTGKVVVKKQTNTKVPTTSQTPTETTRSLIKDSVDTLTPDKNPLWASAVDKLSALDNSQPTAQTSWFVIFLEGLLGGLLAILTPCVWPIIPMTAGFFIRRNKSRKGALADALAYGSAIILIYLSLGLLLTLLYGPNALNALSTNAVFNIFLFLLLTVFGISFLGAFELSLPSSWANSLNARSENTTGYLSIIFMAFTLAVVSFSCTGPIIGVLLVAVSTQGLAAPFFGMLGFALALAIPFSLLALFPNLLKSLPRSGNWMTTIKVFLGFLELAFALKFLSVADMAYGWNILPREAFIALWIAIFSLLTAYLLGIIHLPHSYNNNTPVSIPRLICGLITLSFVVYLTPGMFGAPLRAISAFTPPINTQDFRLSQTAISPHATDYEQGLALARSQNKPVLIDFTGYGCVNCRKMEAAVWTDPRVAQILSSQYILVSLYVDDKTPLPSPIDIVEDGQNRTLNTIGDKWSYLQRHRFGANAQPFYVITDANGIPLKPARAYNENIEEYLNFLELPQATNN